jgi:biotin carboxyl carrier protein
MSNTPTKDFPRSACLLTTGQPVDVTLASSDAPAPARHSFEMVVNTGKVMNHPFWGRFAVDLEGVEVPTKNVPALLDHEQAKRVGFAEPAAFKITEGVGLETTGKLLKTSEHAKTVLTDSAEGFPFQASPFLQPTLLEEVEDGETVTVNGRELEGPGTVFRASRLLEVSFVSVGADDDTVATAFAAGDSTISANLFQKKEPEPMEHQNKPEAADKAVELEAEAVETVTEEATELQETEGKVLAPKAGTVLELLVEVGDEVEEGQELAVLEVAEEEAAEDADETEAPAEMAAAPQPEPAAQGDVALERARSSKILEAAHSSQAALAAELVGNGSILEDALLALQLDSTRRLSGVVGELEANSDAPLGGANADGDLAAEGTEAALRGEWNQNAALRGEFRDSFEDYLAFKNAAAAGRVRLHRTESA